MKRTVAFVALLACSTSLAAPFVTVDGRMFVDGVALDDVVDVAIEVRGADGLSRLSATETAVVVVDGAFALDVDIGAFADELAAGETMTVEIAVADLVSTAVIGPVYGANEAAIADVATTATTATALGTIDGASLVAANAIAAAGGISIAFANLTNVPAGIADGIDNGSLDAVGSGLTITAGTLRLTAVTSAQIVDGTVPAAALAPTSFSSSQITGLLAADVASATVTSRSLQAGMYTALTDMSGTKRALFIRNAACAATGAESDERLTTASTCTRRTCEDGRIQCSTTLTCVSGGSTTCNNDRLGHLVFAP